MDPSPDNRADIRDFLASRRARITPEQIGLPANGQRRVPGLRREEVAVLAGVSIEWYIRLEKDHISGVSEDVLDAVAQALHLDEDERTYLFDPARAARPARHTPPRRKDVEVPARIQWMLDSMTLSAAFVRNGRLDIVAGNALARALHAPMFDSHATAEDGRANFTRYFFLDPGSQHFFVDWEARAIATAALLRAEAGREPHDRALCELVGDCPLRVPSSVVCGLRTMSASATTASSGYGIPRWASWSCRTTLWNCPFPRSVHDLTIYTSEPGTASEDRFKLLASWAATQPPATERTRHKTR